MNKYGSLATWGNFLVSLRQTLHNPKAASLIAEETQISVATVYRLLRELKELGMVEIKKEELKRYRKGPSRKVNLWGLTRKGLWLAKGFQESGVMNHKS